MYFMEPQSITLILPLPPSINVAYATDFRTRRRYLTKVAKDYYSEIKDYLKTKKYNTLEGEVIVNFVYYFKDHRIRDVSNYIKILEDSLVKNKVITDDSRVRKLYVEKEYDKKNPRVEVLITRDSKKLKIVQYLRRMILKLQGVDK